MWHAAEGGGWAYCMVVFNATSAAEALTAEAAAYDTADADNGCSGHPHTVMTSVPMPLDGTWLTNFGATVAVSDEVWYSSADYDGTGELYESAYTVELYTPTLAVLHNPADDEYNPSLFTKVMWHAAEGGGWAYCMVVFNATSAAEALTADDAAYDAADADNGCSGHPHTVMTSVPMPLDGTWLTNFGATVAVSDEVWFSSADYDGTGELYESAYTVELYTPTLAVLHNPADDEYNPSLFTKVMWHAAEGGGWAYCMVVFNATSAAEALTAEAAAYDAADADNGCSGHPHTVMTSST